MKLDILPSRRPVISTALLLLTALALFPALATAAVQDVAGNNLAASTPSPNETYTLDNTPPTVSSVTLSATEVTDSGPATMTVTVNYNEPMDDSGSNDPAIGFTGAANGIIGTTVSTSWPTDTQFVYTFNVLDINADVLGANVQVSGAEDVATNTQTAYDAPSASGALNVRQDNPAIASTASGTISAGITAYEITLTFDEVMDPGSTVTATFPDEDPTSAITLDPGNSGWEAGNQTYVIAYTVTDADLNFAAIDFALAGATDVDGNLMTPFTLFVTADQVEPTVTNVTPNLATVTDSDVGTDTFTLTFDFSEDMNSSPPTVSFPNDPQVLSALTATGYFWPDSDTVVFTYNVVDANVSIADVDVRIANAQDNAFSFNTMVDHDETGVFAIEQSNPTVTVSVDDDLLNISDIPGSPDATFTITFDRAMNPAQVPGLFFTPDVVGSGDLSATGTPAWSAGNTIYTISYDLNNNDREIEDIDVTVTNALLADTNGNLLLANRTTTDLFTIDTAIPTPPFITTPIEGDDIINAVEDGDVLVAGTGAVPNQDVTVTITDGGGAVNQTVTADPSGNWTLLGNELNVTSLNQGPLTVNAIAFDPNGNPSIPATENVTYDSVAPLEPSVPDLAASSDSNINNDDVTNASTLEFVGFADPGNTVQLFRDGTPLGMTTADGSGNWDISDTPAEGIYTYTARQTDPAGNTGPASLGTTVTVDRTDPSGYTVAFDDDLINLAEQGSISFTITNGDEVGSTFNYVISDGTNNINNPGTISDATSQTVSGINVSGLDDGTLNLGLQITDLAGNQGASAIDTATKDTTAPSGYSVAFDDTLINASEAANTTFTLTGGEIGATFNYNITDVVSAQIIGSATISSDPQTVTANVTTLEDGVLTLNVTLVDPAGNFGATASDNSATLDQTAPAAPPAPDLFSISDTGDSGADDITKATNLEFVGTVEPGATVEIFRDGVPQDTTTANGTTGDYSITLNESALPDGDYDYTVAATDLAGNTGGTSTALTVTIDRTAPTGYAVAFDDDLLNAAEIGSVSFTISNVDDGYRYFLGVTSNNGGTPLITDALISGDPTTLSSVPLGALNDGTLTVTVSLEDLAGNEGNDATDTATKDTTAPAKPNPPDLAAASDLGDSDSDDFTSATTVTLQGGPTWSNAVEANADVALLRDGNPTGETTTADANGAYSFTLDESALADGVYSYSVRATDTAGNTSPESEVLGVEYDRTPPPVPGAPDLTAGSDTGPIPTDNITNATNLEFTLTAYGESAVDLELLREGTLAYVIPNWGPLDGLPSFTDAGPAEGTYSYTIRATDEAGNTSTSPGTPVSIDRTAPSGFSVAFDDDLINAAEAPSISVTFGGAEVGTIYSLTFADVGFAHTVTPPTGPVTAANQQVGGIDISSLNDGAVTVSLDLTDIAGNSTTGSGAVGVSVKDTTAPATPGAPDLAATSDSGDSDTDDITNAGVLLLEGTVEAGADIEIFLNGVSRATTTGDAVTGAYSILLSEPFLADGAYDYTLEATDAAGNTSTTSPALTVTIDRTAPAAPTGLDLLAGSDTGDLDSDNITRDDTPTISGDAETDSTVELTSSIDGSIGSGTASSPFSITASTLSAGEHDITATATDVAGNTSTASTALAIQIVPDATPELTIDFTLVGDTSIDENGGTADYPATLNHATDMEVTYDMAWDPNTGDLALTQSGVVPIGATASSTSAVLTGQDDAIVEGHETFQVEAASVAHATATTDSAPLHVNDDDTAEVTIAATPSPLTEAGDNTTFTVTMSAVASVDVIVDLSSGGDATAVDDYTPAIPTSVTIAAGDTTADFVVTTVEDEIDESDETFSATLTGTDNTSVTVGATDTAEVTITDDDETPVLGGTPLTDVNYTEDDPATVISAALTLTDGDNSPQTVIFAITGNYDDTEDVLTATASGAANVNWDSTTGELRIDGTLADVAATIATVAYRNDDLENPSELSRLVRIQATDDGGNVSNEATVTINVARQNDAPVLTQQAPALTTDEDTTVTTPVHPGLVDVLGSPGVAGSRTGYDDVDDGASLGGIAVYDYVGNGGWFYDIGGNVTFIPDGGTAADPYLIPAGAELGYEPDGENGETASLFYFLWDGTAGTAESFVNAATVGQGGSGSLSTDFDRITIEVDSVNDAPVLTLTDFNLNTILGYTITEDDTDPPAMPVQDIIAGATDGVDDGEEYGLAIYETIGEGDWMWYPAGGPDWIYMDPLSYNAARLIPADGSLRFVPDPNYNDGQTASIRFKLWDESVGTAGGTLDLELYDPVLAVAKDAAPTDNTDPVSEANGLATLEVDAVNDAPVAVADAISLFAQQTVTINVLANDFDVDPGDTFTIVDAVVGQGTVNIIDAGTALQYTAPAGAFGGTTITYTINDGELDGVGTVAVTFDGFLPEITILTSDQTISEGGTVELVATVSAIPDASVQWYRGSIGDTRRPVGTGAAVTTSQLVEDSRFWVRATNVVGTATSGTVEVTVERVRPLLVTTGPLQGQVGVYLEVQLETDRPTTSYSASSLPPGLTLNPTTGLISGTPTLDGNFNSTFSVANATGNTLKSVGWVIKPSLPIIVSLLQAAGTVGEGFEYPIVATNDPDSYGAMGLPPGVGFSPVTGVLAGTPTTEGTYEVMISATNAAGTHAETLVVTIFSVQPRPEMQVNASVQGEVGVPLEFMLLASGDPEAYEADDLPPGLELDPATGLISGIPTQVGSYRVGTRATNEVGTGATFTVLFVIAPAQGRPEITSADEARAQVGQAFSYPLEATANPASFRADGLPGGLTLDTTTGEISGTPTQAGTFVVEVAASNAAGEGPADGLTLVIAPAAAAPVITSPVILSATAGESFSTQLTATDNPTSFGAMDLPAGLSLAPASGVISGTAPAAGLYPFSTYAVNASGQGPIQPMSLQVSAAPDQPVVAGDVVAGTIAQPLNYPVQATNDPDSFSVDELPPGLSLDASTGVISGIPTKVGDFAAEITASNAAGSSAPAHFIFTIAPPSRGPVILSQQTARGQVGRYFEYQIVASRPPILAYFAGNLPRGLSFDPATGLISGRPEEAGTTTVQLAATNNAGQGPSKMLTLSIDAPPQAPVITSPAVAVTTQRELFSYRIDATGEPTGYTATGLPRGLALDSTEGVLRGRVVKSGRYEITLQAFNAIGGSDPLPLLLSVQPGLDAPRITSARVTRQLAGEPFHYTLTASNLPTERPLPPGNFFQVRNLPAGLVLNPATGEISGTTPLDDFTFSATAESTFSCGLFVDIRVVVGPSPQQPRVRAPYALQGRAGETLTITLTSPDEVDLYRLRGSPEAFSPAGEARVDGVFHWQPEPFGETTLLAQAGKLLPPPANFWVWSEPQPIRVTTLPAGNAPVMTSARFLRGRVGLDFSYRPSASTPATFLVTPLTPPSDPRGEPRLPRGLTLDPVTGIIAGQPREAGMFAFRVQPINGAGTGSPQAVQLLVRPNPALADDFTIDGGADGGGHGGSDEPQLVGEVGALLTARVVPAGDFDSVVARDLPDGITFRSNTGEIIGVPTRPGTFFPTFAVVENGFEGAPFTVMLSVLPTPGTVAVTAPGEVSAVADEALAVMLETNGEAASFNALDLPDGLELDSETGQLSGALSVPGNYTVEVSANNAVGEGASHSVAVTITPKTGTPQLTSATTAAAQVGNAFNLALQASGGVTGFEVIGLPPGLTVNEGTGQISGTPLEQGTFAVNVRPYNQVGSGPVSIVAITVNAANGTPVISSPLIATAQENESFTQLLTATNNPVSFNLEGDVPGLEFQPATGLLQGTPTEPGVYELSLSANNKQGEGQRVVFTLTVEGIENLPPLAEDLVAETAEDTNLMVLLLATDENGDPLSYEIVSPPQHGTVSNPSGNQITYRPEANFSGQDSFTYRASDGELFSEVRTVTINVVAVNDPPQLTRNLGTRTVGQGTPSLAIDLAGLFTDAEDDDATLRYAVFAISNPAVVTDWSVNGQVLTLALGATTGSSQVTIEAADSADAINRTVFTVIIAPGASIAAGELTAGDVSNVWIQEVTVDNPTDSPLAFYRLLVAALPEGVVVLNAGGFDASGEAFYADADLPAGAQRVYTVQLQVPDGFDPQTLEPVYVLNDDITDLLWGNGTRSEEAPGWVESPLIGWFNDTTYPWINHAALGFLYASQERFGGIWFWSEAHEWIYLAEGIFPAFYRWQDNTWLWYFENEDGVALGYNFSTGEWETL